jgi:hypothetical protein
MLQSLTGPRGAADLDKFRLRRFVDHLVEIGEAIVHPEPIALADLSAAIAATPKAVLFKRRPRALRDRGRGLRQPRPARRGIRGRPTPGRA